MQLENTDLYPTRKGQDEIIMPRLDPTVYSTHDPSLNSTLSQQHLDHFGHNGFLVLPGYMSDWIDSLQQEVDQLKHAMAGREELITEPDNNELRTLFDPVQNSALIRGFFSHPKILNIARRLLGSEVYAMQSRVNIKPAFTGRSFPWHSDFETWHVEDGMPRMRALTAWIMLTDNHEQNGPLYVIPGSHKHYVSCSGITQENNFATSLKKQTLGVPQQHTMQKLMDNRKIQSVVGQAGTVVFHECNIMHGSPDNISADPRSILMCVFNSMENIAHTPYSGLPPRPDYLNNRHPIALEAQDVQPQSAINISKVA